VIVERRTCRGCGASRPLFRFGLYRTPSGAISRRHRCDECRGKQIAAGSHRWRLRRGLAGRGVAHRARDARGRFV